MKIKIKYFVIVALLCFQCTTNENEQEKINKSQGFKNKGGYYEMPEVILKGIFRGVSLYVENPRNEDGHSCVYEVKVNGCISTNSIFYSKSTFEIELDDYCVSEGDSLTVVIIHREGCKPKVLNPEVITGNYKKKY